MKTCTRMLAVIIFSFLMLGSMVGCDDKKSPEKTMEKALAKQKEVSERVVLVNAKIGTVGPNKEQTVCPITGKPVNKQCFADRDGKRIYGCSSTCVNAFASMPSIFKSYALAMEKGGVVLEKTSGPNTVANIPAPVTPVK